MVTPSHFGRSPLFLSGSPKYYTLYHSGHVYSNVPPPTNPTIMKNILVVDDHPIMRMSVIQMLKTGLDQVGFGEAANAGQALTKLREEKWDIVVLDMEMPGRSGLDVLRQLKRKKFKVRTLIFSSLPADHIAIRAFKAGAYGYLSKKASREELVGAVSQLLEGKKYFTAECAELLAEEITNSSRSPIPASARLSDREYDTLLLIAKGKPIRLIAKELVLSASTVNTFRHRILSKMGMKTDMQLISYAISNNLVRFPASICSMNTTS
jgi:two-component system, NarL family, invasion response regulator UvrY